MDPDIKRQGGINSVGDKVAATASYRYVVWRYTHKVRIQQPDGSVRLYAPRWPAGMVASHLTAQFDNRACWDGLARDDARVQGLVIELTAAERAWINEDRKACNTLIRPSTWIDSSKRALIPPGVSECKSLCPHWWNPCLGPVLIHLNTWRCG